MAANNICILKIASTIFAILTFSSNFMITPINSEEFSREVSMEEMGLKTEKLTHLHFYFHDIGRDRHPTAFRVAESHQIRLSHLHFYFHDIGRDRHQPRSEWRNPTRFGFGRIAVYSAVWEMPIVGGSGVFRSARGYARASTQEINMQITGVVVVEYNVYVFHY
ncbi:hypothetical protein ABFS83_06G133200 [Erythranthe nasuta]